MSLQNILDSIPDLTDEMEKVKVVTLEEVFSIYPGMMRDSPLPYIIYREKNNGLLSSEEYDTISRIIEKLKTNEQYINQLNLKKMLEGN